MQKVVSFIIPAYNSQDYLRKCLDSFLAESVLARIEVIVINDGSSDGTEKLAEEYVSRCPDTFRLCSKENGGHGSAINAGAKAASGKYLKVIDADDWVDTGNLERVVGRLETCSAQAVLMPYHTVDMATGKRTSCGLCGEDGRIYTLDEMVRNWQALENGITFHGVTYRTDFYRKNGIRLAEHVFYEDHEYSTIPLCRAESICEMHDGLYEYLIGNAAQSVSARSQVRRLGDMEAVLEHMARYYRKHRDLTEAARQFYRRKAEILALAYYRAACLLSPDRKEGRLRVKRENRRLFRLVPEWKAGFRKKYLVFAFLGAARISLEQYERMMDSRLYGWIRGRRGGVRS